jgi:four helix bundle protein
MRTAKRYQDLYCYQLAVEMRRTVLALTKREPVRRNFRYVSQLEDSARGAARNIAEGHSRFNPTEIVPFASYAKASTDETGNHIVDGVEEGFFSKEEAEQVLNIIDRLIPALLNWIRYLESPAARRFYEEFKKRRQRGEPTKGLRERLSTATGNPTATSPANPNPNPNPNPSPNSNSNKRTSEPQNPRTSELTEDK